MDELDRGGELQVTIAPVAAQPGGSQREQRPQSLAPGRDDVARELGDERDRRIHPADDQSVYRLKILCDELGQGIERSLRIGFAQVSVGDGSHRISTSC